ncbi:hypothetical protein AB7X14_15425, partial [Providencia huaxiensis]
EWVHVQLHQQKGMISLSPPTICNSAFLTCASKYPDIFQLNYLGYMKWRDVFRLFNHGSKYNRFIRLAISLKLIR